MSTQNLVCPIMIENEMITAIIFKMTEYKLVRSIIKNGVPFFEVCKEGLLFLRQFRNKKVLSP